MIHKKCKIHFDNFMLCPNVFSTKNTKKNLFCFGIQKLDMRDIWLVLRPVDRGSAIPANAMGHQNNPFGW